MRTIRILVPVIAMMLSAGVAYAGGGTAFTYQGELTESGNPANGSYDMDFALWDALASGNQVGSTVTYLSWPITDGLVTVELDFGQGAFNDARWLEIVVNGMTLSPRSPVLAAPLALQMRGMFVDPVTGFIGINHTSPNARLHIESENDPGLYVQTTGHNGIIVTVNTAATFGIHATSTHASGHGLFGEVDGPVGIGLGVLGRSAADQGIGVQGIATNDIGFGNGAEGIAYSDLGHGVHGENLEGGFAGYFEGDGYFSQRLFVGREDFVTSAEYFGFNAPVDTGYGGMYISTDGESAWPFYGYATGGTGDMWHYFDGTTGKWHLHIGNNERFTVQSNGEVGIGTVSPAFLLHVNGSAGKPGGGSWSNASDRRLKKNIQDIDGALDSLLKLRGVTFEYIDAKSINELEGERIGVIAQEVQQVFPDWIGERDDGYKTVTFRGFEAMTVEALRELRNEKDRQVARLEGKNKELQSTQIAHRQQIAILNSDNEALRQRLSNLESIVSELNAQEK